MKLTWVSRGTADCCSRRGEKHAQQSLSKTFGTMTADLLELGDWLAAHGVTHVALESTGVVRREVAIK